MTTAFTPEQKQEIKGIVHEALTDFFTGYGQTGKQFIITAAIVVGSVTVILGGFKTVLGWLGFTMLSR
jgi:hypothetical protein